MNCLIPWVLWLTTVYLVTYFMAPAGSFFSFEWFYLLLCLLFLSSFPWSVFVWVLHSSFSSITHLYMRGVCFWLPCLIPAHRVGRAALWASSSSWAVVSCRDATASQSVRPFMLSPLESRVAPPSPLQAASYKCDGCISPFGLTSPAPPGYQAASRKSPAAGTHPISIVSD